MTPGTCVNEAVFYYTCEKCGAIESDRNHIFKGEIILKIIIRPISGKVIIPDTGMNVRIVKKNLILLICFRLDFCVDGKLENVLYCIT